MSSAKATTVAMARCSLGAAGKQFRVPDWTSITLTMARVMRKGDEEGVGTKKASVLGYSSVPRNHGTTSEDFPRDLPWLETVDLAG